MTIEELSNRYLEGGFGIDIFHSNEDPPDASFNDNSSDFLEHYGVLGMKWGVRKDKKELRKKKDRRYEDESDMEYQSRMTRESNERTAKLQAKQRSKSERIASKERVKIQKMMLKSQEKQQKRQLESQKRQQEEQRKERERQEKQVKKIEKKERIDKKTKSKPTNVRHLTDRELSDAIQRLRSEQEYKRLSLENKSLPKKTIIKAATIGGGVLLAVGTAVAKKQLTDVGNQKASEFLSKKGWLKQSGSGGTPQQVTIDDIRNLVQKYNQQR